MAFNRLLFLGTLLASASLNVATVPIYGQCAGLTYTGETTCDSGLVCTYFNDYYSQCLQGTATATTTTKATTTTTVISTSTATGLHKFAKAKGKVWFGTAVDNSEITDTSYKALISNTLDFGQLTPGNAMKWDATEASRGVFTYTKANEIVTLAQTNGQLIRGHTLVWHSQLPTWVSSGGFDNATLLSIVTNHATNVVSQFKGKIYAWDVVNEVLNDDGTFRTSVFYTTCGEYFIDAAFIAARAADPAAKLFINDYNIDGTGAKSTAMYNLVQRLKARGVPVDGIGAQAHLIVGSVPTTIATNWATLTSLGVDLHVTELDIRMTLPDDATKQAQQAKDYATVINACVAVTRCTAMTIWGASDKYSWIPSVFSGQGDALPWDANFAKKPAYWSISSSLGGPAS